MLSPQDIVLPIHFQTAELPDRNNRKPDRSCVAWEPGGGCTQDGVGPRAILIAVGVRYFALGRVEIRMGRKNATVEGGDPNLGTC
jgi:hypothetical protein